MRKYLSFLMLVILSASLSSYAIAQDKSELLNYGPIINDITIKIYKSYPTVDPQLIKNTIENMIKGTIAKGGNPQDSLEDIQKQVTDDPQGKIGKVISSMSKSISQESTSTNITKPSDIDSSKSNDSLSLYRNPDYDFSINYPSSWDILTGSRIPGSHVEEIEPIVVFVPPGEIATSNAFTAFVEVAINHEADDLDLSGVIQDNIRDIMVDTSLTNFRIDNANTNGSLSGKPAYILSYSADRTNLQGSTTFVVKEIGTKVGDDYYFIDYIASKDKENKYLPLAQDMAKSFKLNGIIKD